MTTSGRMAIYLSLSLAAAAIRASTVTPIPLSKECPFCDTTNQCSAFFAIRFSPEGTADKTELMETLLAVLSSPDCKSKRIVEMEMDFAQTPDWFQKEFLSSSLKREREFAARSLATAYDEDNNWRFLKSAFLKMPFFEEFRQKVSVMGRTATVSPYRGEYLDLKGDETSRRWTDFSPVVSNFQKWVKFSCDIRVRDNTPIPQSVTTILTPGTIPLRIERAASTQRKGTGAAAVEWKSVVPPGFTSSQVSLRSLSADGMVALYDVEGCGYPGPRSLVWRRAVAPPELLHPFGDPEGMATDAAFLSRDGQVIAGEASTPSARTYAFIKDGTNSMAALGMAVPMAICARATCLSPDGTWVGGATLRHGAPELGWLWHNGQYRILTLREKGILSVIPTCVADGGNVIAGLVEKEDCSWPEPFLIREGIFCVLNESPSVPAGLKINRIDSISEDGSLFLGKGFDVKNGEVGVRVRCTGEASRKLRGQQTEGQGGVKR